jgi:hypothetical protein
MSPWDGLSVNRPHAVLYERDLAVTIIHAYDDAALP